MKHLRRFRTPLGWLMTVLVAFWQIVSSMPLQSAALYWDPDGNPVGNNGSGLGLGGTGTWNIATSHWWNGTSDVPWPNTNIDQAIFGGPDASFLAPKTVTLVSGIVANQLKFERNGYTLTAGTLTLAGTTPGVYVNMGETVVINSLVQGTDGFTKTGRGTVRLGNAANSYTGVTNITNGTVVISNQAALGTDTSTVVVSGSATRGFGGGQLMLEGAGYGTSGSFTRNLSLQGLGPLSDRSAALITVGDHVLTGSVSMGVGSVNTRVISPVGLLTFAGGLDVAGVAGTTVSSLGGVNTGGTGSYSITGALTGSGTLEKSGGGTLFLNPSDTSGFSGVIRVSGSVTTVQQSSVRITSAGVLGTRNATGTSGVLDMNGGLLEVRMDAPSVLAGGTAATVYGRASSTLFADHGIGGQTVNGTVAFNQLAFEDNITLTFNSRNGYGMSFTAAPVNGGNANSTFTNNMGGLLTFTGSFWSNTENGGNRTVTIGGTGNTLISGNLVASAAAFDHNLTKTGAGLLTISSTGSTLDGNVNIQAGALAITDFRSITNNTAAVNIGNTGTGGALIIGTSVASSAAGLTTSKAINLSGTSGGATIYASQSGTDAVILNTVTNTGAGAKTLSLGGTNTANNIINSALSNNGANVLSLSKNGSGTWVLAGANGYTGATTITNGTLKIQDTFSAGSRDVLATGSAITFNALTATQEAGGAFEYLGAAGSPSTEAVGALTPTAGAGTVKVTAGAGGTATLTFASLAARTAGVGSTINYVPGTNGTIAFSTAPAVTNGIIAAASGGAAYQTFNGVDWATLAGSNVAQYTGYSLNALPASGTGGANTNFAQAVSASTTTAASINTLKVIGGVSHPVITLGGTLTLTAKGVLFDNTAGSATITGSQLGAANVETIIITNGTNANHSLTVNSLIGSGTGVLTKSGTSTLIIGGANTYTGNTHINEGTVRLSGATATLGSISVAGTTMAIRQGATLDINAAGASNTVVIGALNGAGTITNSGRGSGTAGTVSIGSSSTTATGTFSGVLQDGSGVLNVKKDGTGAQSLIGLNTYTGVTTIASTGSIVVNVLADIGEASGIGAGNASNNAGSLVFTGSTGGLTYQGALMNGALTLGSTSAETNRLFTLAGTGATLTSNASNGNAVVFTNTGDIVHGVVGAQTLVFRGSSTGDNRLNPRITDSGVGANITGVTKQEAGKWVLGNANNTYSGVTRLENGTLELASSGSLSSNSGLIFGNLATSGVLEMSGTFTRTLSTTAGAGTVTWNSNLTTGGGGFAASGSKLVVNIGGAGATLKWNTGGFVNTGAALVLGSTTALSEVEFRNGIDLDGGSRTINVNDNTATGADFATITGVISNSNPANSGLSKGGTGILQLFANNTYAGTTAVTAGTLVVQSLGNSTVGGATSIGSATDANQVSGSLTLGNAGTGGAVLIYVGAGEVSDRLIRLNSTTGTNQIHADGTGALVLTNVLNDMATGIKTLNLRGANTAGNMITSQLNDNGGALTVLVDGSATWILTNTNTYTGGTTVNAGALGIGSDGALGTGALTLSNSTVFAYGGDRTVANAVSQGNNTTQAFSGDYTLNLTGTYALGAAANNIVITNTIADGETLILDAMTANLMTDHRTFTIGGTGHTQINGAITTSTASNLNITYSGTGTLTLAGTGSDWNNGTLTVSNGTLRLGNSEVIADSSSADSGNVIFNPAAGVTATFDLNGKVETINGLTVNSAGTVVFDNTSSDGASLTFGANNQVVDFGSGVGNYTITDSGSGALSIIKTGTNNAVIGSGVSLTYQGTTSVIGGTLTIGAAMNGSTGLSATNFGSVLALSGGIANTAAISSITVGDGATLSLVDGTGNKLMNLTNLSLGSGGGTVSFLNLNVGDGVTTGDNLNTDLLALNGALSLFAGNQVVFNLTDAGLRANTTYTILTSATGGLLSGNLTAADWVLGSTPGGFSTITLNKTDNIISITTGLLLTSPLYWNGNGGADQWSEVANWSTNKAGTTAAATVPGQATDVVFIADNISGGAAVTTTLEQNVKINSLTFEASTLPANTPSSVTIGPGASILNRLEIAPQNAATGITIAPGATPSVTISAALRIGADQTWHLADGASVLTLSGGLQGGADVTKTGLGRVVLTAAADVVFNVGLTSDFTINAGTLEMTNATALGSAGGNNLANVIVNTGGVFYYNNATAGTVANNLRLGGGTLSAGGTTQTYSGAVEVTAGSFINMRDQNSPTPTTTARNITLSGVLSGTGSLTVDSINTVGSGNQITGNLTFSGSNTGWSGALNILRGTVIASNADALGTGAINIELGKVSYTGIGGVTYNIAKNVTVSSATGNAIAEWHTDRTSGTDPFVVNNSGSFTLGGAGGTGELRLFLADGTGSVPILSGGVILANNGRISVRDASTSVATITGVGITQVGGARSLTINDLSVWTGTAGVLHIDAASSYTGGTTINGGGLRFGHKDAIGSGALTIAASSTLSASTALTGANKVTNAIQLNSTLTFNGNNTLELGGAVSMAAGRTINASGSPGAQLILSGGITATGNSTLALGGTGTGVISGGLNQSGTSAAFDVNSGFWTLTGADFIVAGDFTLDGGTVTIEDITFTLGDDIIATGATSVLNLNAASIWTPSNPVGTSSHMFVRGGATVNLNAHDVTGVNNINEVDGILLGDGTTTGIGTLNTNTFNITLPRLDLGGIATGFEGRAIGSGTITVNYTDTDYAQGIRLFRGLISANLAGSAPILKQGLGDVTLSGDNSGLTGATAANTRIDAGNLILDYTTSNAAKIPSNRAVDMRGGTLTVNGNASAATTVAVSGLTMANGSGMNTVAVISNGTAATLNLGAITRTALSNDGTVRFNLPTLGAITTTTANTNGILGGWATVRDTSGQVNFATKEDVTNRIIAVTTTAQDNMALWTAGQHITDSAGVFGTRQFTGIGSLRLNANATTSLNISTGGYLHIASGGLLMTENVDAVSHSISGGTLSSGFGAGELIFMLDNAVQNLHVSSAIIGGSGVTKVGNGILTLSGYNIYSGATDIQSGTVIAAGGFAIGDSSVVTLSDDRASTLQITANETFGGLGGGTPTTGLAFGVVEFGSNNLYLRGGATYGGLLVGSGQIIKDISANSGNQAFTNNNTGFTGTVIVNGGLFQLAGAAGRMNQATSFTINKGGSFLIDNDDDSSPNDRLSNTVAVTLNSADGTFSGETIVRGLTIRTNNNNGEDETIGVLTFNSGASYFTGNATGNTSSNTALFVENFVRNNGATLNVRGTNLGGTANARAQLRINNTGFAANETAFITNNLVGGGGAAGSEQVSIVPWAIGQNGTAADTVAGNTVMGNSLVTYAAGSGFRALDFATEYNAFSEIEGATDNIRESRTTDLLGLGSMTINSLVINNDNATSTFTSVEVMGNGAGSALTVSSGALLFTLNPGATGVATRDIELGGFGSGIAVGGTEYLIYVVNPSAAASTTGLAAIISSDLTSVADITKSGRGILVLSGSNTAGGGARKTTINEGVLQISDLDNIGGNTGELVFAGGTLLMDSFFPDDLSLRTITMLQGGGTIHTGAQDYTFANNIGNGGIGGMVKNGLGNLTLQGSATYLGTTHVVDGRLTLAGGANNRLNTNAPLVLGLGALSGILQLGNSAGVSHQTVRELSSVGTGNMNSVVGGNAAVSTLTVNQSTVTTFGGKFGGPGANENNISVIKTGAGTLIISGPSTFTGGLFIKSGAVIAGNGSDPLGGIGNIVTIGDTSGSANATLHLQDSQQYAAAIHVAAGSTGALSLLGGGTTQSPTLFGAITLNNNLIIGKLGTTGNFVVRGGIAGTGNIVLANMGTTGTLQITTNAVNHSGSITNNGFATVATLISADIGSNVTHITQDSVTSGLTLSGASIAYTGITSVNAGVLSITGGAVSGLSTTGLVVAGGATLNTNNTAGQLVNMGTGPLNLGAGSGTATLGFELGSTSAYDSFRTTVGAVTANNIVFNLTGLAGFGAGNYDLLTAAGGLNNATYSVGTMSGALNGVTLSLVVDPNFVRLAAAASTGSFYWRGGINNSWMGNNGLLTNFTTDLAGTINANGTPGAASTVYFSAQNVTGPAITTTLDSSFTINDLRFLASPTGVTSVTIAPGTPTTSSLTIAPSSSADGIHVADNAGAITISAPIVLGANQTWTVAGTGVNGSSLTVSGGVTGANTLTIASPGSGIVTFLGTANTYSGGTTVSSGILRAGVANTFSANSTYSVSAGGILRLNGFSNAIGGLAGAGIVENGTATNATLTVGANTASTTFSGTLQNGSTGTLALTKVGTGKLTLSGTNTFTGSATVNGGKLEITGDTNNGAGQINLGTGAGTRGMLLVGPGAVVTTTDSDMGTNATGAGAGYQSGGTFTITGADATNRFTLGASAGGYGSYKLSGGTLNSARLTTAGNNFAGATGVFEQTGGTANFTTWAVIGHGSGNALVDVSGGNFNVGTDFALNHVANAYSVVNVRNTGVITKTGANAISLLRGNANSVNNIGVFNVLSGGVLAVSAGGVTAGAGTGSSGNVAMLNFNGGTLRTNAASSNLISITGAALTAKSGAYIYSGGMTVDTNGFDSVISSPLLAPEASGVQSIAVSNGGSGYIGAPVIKITGGSGEGATAIANMVDDGAGNGTFMIGSITITNPGTGYLPTDVLTVAFGDNTSVYTTQATLGAVAFNGGNTSGGLTKMGTGKLTLSAVNTYTGGTTVQNGTLALGAANVLADSGAVTVNGGTFDIATFNETVGTMTLQSGAITGTTGVLTSAGYFVESGTVSAILAGTGGLTKNTAGTVTLSGVNTFSGGVNVNGGTLAFSTLTNLGAATNTFNFNGGALSYTGAGAQALGAAQTVAVAAGGATFDVSNVTGTLTVAGNVTGSAGGDLTKTGLGTLLLTGTNNLGTGGAVNVQAGTLRAGFGTGGASAINVSGAGTLELYDGVAQSLTLGGTAGALTLSDGATLGFELGAPGTYDSIIVAAGGAAVTSGTITLNLLNLGGLASGTYDLISVAGGGLNAANYVVGNTPAGFNFTINKTDTLVQLIAASLVQRYWTGDTFSGSWATNNTGDTNWASNAAGTTDSGTTPVAGDTVIFSATNAVGPVVTSTLDGSYTIDSLQFIAAPVGVTSVSIASGSGGTLTLAPATPSNGISVAANAGNISITAAIIASTLQTWSVDGTGSSLSVSGNTTFTSRVTKSGGGALTLGGTNSGAGGINLAGGTLNINSATALGTGAFAIGAGTTINNTSGISLFLTTNNTKLWEGDFTFTGSNALDMGGGAVTMADDVVLAGNGSTLTVGGAIGDGADNFLLTKTGAGALSLAGANTWSGGMTLSGGTLNINNATALGTGLFTINGSTTINNSSGSAVTMTANNAMVWNGDFTFTGTFGLNLGTGAVNFGTAAGTSRTVTVSGGTLTVGGPITNGTTANSFVKLGAGTLRLTGLSTTAANNYTGGTTLGGGTTILTSSVNFTGGLTIGSTAASTIISTLDLSTASATFGGPMVVQTNSTTANTITIGNGQTLQVNNAFTLGYNSGANTSTRLTISGGGTFSIGAVGSPTNAGVTLGGNITTQFSNATILDMSGLSNFYANLGSGSFRVGDITNSGGQAAVNSGSTLILAANSTIIATLLSSDSPDSAVTQTIRLGSGTNVIQANTINIGGTATGRSSGVLNFNTGTGTLQVRDVAGTGRATMNIAYGGITTTAAPTSTVDFTGHSVDLLLGMLNVGGRTGTSGGASSGTFTFDTGTLDATGVVAGDRRNTATNAATSTGTVHLNGGTVIIGNSGVVLGTSIASQAGSVATGTLNITNNAIVTVGATSGVSITLGKSTVAGMAANGTLNITGTSSLTVAGNIIEGTGAGNASVVSTLTLNGGTLNMSGNNIGTATEQINVLNFQSGTLANVNEINGGAAIAKTTAGTLILEGVNNYSGITTISAGVLQVGSGAGTGTLGSGNVTNNAILRFNRNNSYTASQSITGTGAVQQVGTGITVLGGANAYAGGTTVSAGTVVANHTSALGTGDVSVSSTGTLSVGNGSRLNVNIGGSLNTSGTLQFDIFGRQAGSNPVINSDLLTLNSSDIGDSITLTGTLRVVDTTGTSASTWALNDMWQLIDWLDFDGTIPAASSNFTGFTALDLPTLSPGLLWNVITNNTGMYIAVVVPEPSRMLLLVLGFLLVFFRRRRR